MRPLDVDFAEFGLLFSLQCLSRLLDGPKSLGRRDVGEGKPLHKAPHPSRALSNILAALLRRTHSEYRKCA